MSHLAGLLTLDACWVLRPDFGLNLEQLIARLASNYALSCTLQLKFGIPSLGDSTEP